MMTLATAAPTRARRGGVCHRKPIMENEIIKRDLIWIAVAAVAIPLALSVINAQAQQADDRPRIGETTAEYNIRIARTRGDREALREAQEKANRETLRESQEKAEKAHRDALLSAGSP